MLAIKQFIHSLEKGRSGCQSAPVGLGRVVSRVQGRIFYPMFNDTKLYIVST
ncbi:MAG: hypothetical protein AB4042_10320 [Leptolyngbyaceae cyanobacterium]